MTDSDAPRRPGPWDSRPPAPAAAPTEPPRSADPPLIKGQTPAWALISTLLLGGLVWFLTGSWVAAVAILFGVFVHEYGHVLAMNAVGMGPARIFIVPFFGGAAQAQRPASSDWHGVLVSLAGPAFGLLAAIPFFALHLVLGGSAWLLGAAMIAALNLVNLAPAPPLDGSRALGPVLARIHPMLEKAALLLVGVAVVCWGVATGRWFLAVFLAIALIGHLQRGAWRPHSRPLTGRESLMSTGLYLVTGLACAGVGMAALIPLAGGSIPGAVDVAGAYLGLER
jgi:Zn-dependent protease